MEISKRVRNKRVGGGKKTRCDQLLKNECKWLFYLNVALIFSKYNSCIQEEYKN